jgi:hypothetical protein
MESFMPLVDRVQFLSSAIPSDLVERLQTERIARLVIGGRPMERGVEPLAQSSIERGLDVMLLTDLSADEPSPDGGVLRGVLRLRKAGATLTNCGQATTILGSHKVRTALVLVNVDPRLRAAFSDPETHSDLEALLARSAKPKP